MTAFRCFDDEGTRSSGSMPRRCEGAFPPGRRNGIPMATSTRGAAGRRVEEWWANWWTRLRIGGIRIHTGVKFALWLKEILGSWASWTRPDRFIGRTSWWSRPARGLRRSCRIWRTSCGRSASRSCTSARGAGRVSTAPLRALGGRHPQYRLVRLRGARRRNPEDRQPWAGHEDRPPDGPREVTAEDEARFRAFLRDSLPGLADAPIIGRRLCLYCDTWDGNFWIDRDPDRPGLVVASGGSGHAFKFGPMLGPIIADVVERKPNRYAARFAWRTRGASTAEDARHL